MKRFVAKFVNGTWVLFDTKTFKHVDTFHFQSEAVASEEEKNRGKT